MSLKLISGREITCREVELLKIDIILKMLKKINLLTLYLLMGHWVLIIALFNVFEKVKYVNN